MTAWSRIPFLTLALMLAASLSLAAAEEAGKTEHADQAEAVKAEPAKAPTDTQPNTPREQASYIVGVQLGRQESHLLDLDAKWLAAGIADVAVGRDLRVDMAKAQGIFALLQREIEAAAKATLAAGQAYIAQQAAREEVESTKSGLCYEVLKQGNGAKPKLDDRVQVRYHGTLIDGKVFDSTRKRGDEPVSVAVKGELAGWTEALQLMQVGSTYRLYLPAELAYGAKRIGMIPAQSALIFEVELVAIDAQ